MSTPPPGYEDGWGMAAVILLLAAIALAYRLHDASRRIRVSRPKPPPRRRFLSWDDQKNIRNWQQRRATTGIAAVEAWLTKQNLGDTK